MAAGRALNISIVEDSTVIRDETIDLEKVVKMEYYATTSILRIFLIDQEKPYDLRDDLTTTSILGMYSQWKDYLNNS